MFCAQSLSRSLSLIARNGSTVSTGSWIQNVIFDVLAPTPRPVRKLVTVEGEVHHALGGEPLPNAVQRPLGCYSFSTGNSSRNVKCDVNPFTNYRAYQRSMGDYTASSEVKNSKQSSGNSGQGVKFLAKFRMRNWSWQADLTRRLEFPVQKL